MALPTAPSTVWPPQDPTRADQEEAAAWYSGDTSKLTTVYGSAAKQPKGGRARFWSKASTAPESRQRLHVPAAADIAQVGADMLFGDTPTWQIAEAHEERQKGPDGTLAPLSGEAAVAVATEERLAELIEQDGIAARLLEGAEICGGIGGVYLRPVWDPAFAPHPMLSVVHGDQAVPEWRWGRLAAVTFWRQVAMDDKGAVWRHLERHEPGVILHGLYIGDKDHLGVKVDLSAHPDTAALIGGAGPDNDGVLRLPAGIEGLDVRYVPNVRPNLKHRHLPVGRSDTQGVESLMDSLDETMTSWMRDIRLGKARLVVPQEFLERRGRGQGASFDIDDEIFSPLEMDPSNMDKAGITPVEFKIRTEEHNATCLALMESITRRAGYSPQSFGMQGTGNEQTATEIDAREDRSVRTTTRKRRYWQQAVEDTFYNLLVIDREIFSSGVIPMRPTTEWPEPDSDTLKERGEAVNLIAAARSASIETRVRLLNPDWESERVLAEVEAIKAEESIQVPDPTGGLP